MTRPKTITDEEILAVARSAFRARGHAVTTREIAENAGISEGILYQRFGSKDDLFFASMAPSAPDVEELLGPDPPNESAESFVRRVLPRMAAYLGDVIPLGLHVLMHPSFDRAAIGRAQIGPARLEEGLLRRLTWFESRKQIRKATAHPAARLLVHLAHDAALATVLRHDGRPPGELESMAAIVWAGIAPAERTPKRK